MATPSFERLAADAAAGLTGDRELYLEVTRELASHLEEKADRFGREGHAPEESAALAVKAFGSPLEMAADLLAANRRRMKLRALFRLAFISLIVPLAIVAALYAGYGRMARMQNVAPLTGMYSDSPVSLRLPMLPLLGSDPSLDPASGSALAELRGSPADAERIYRYWEARQHEPESHIYYAYYAIHTEPTHAQYPAVLRRGMEIEPDNALYPLLLAHHYLSRGMIAEAERPKPIEGERRPDELLEREDFETGIAALHIALAKPYLQTYTGRIVRQRLNAFPMPVLTEDYTQGLTTLAQELYPHFSQYRRLGQKISGCARLLAAEGRREEALAIMDGWRPYVRLLAGDDEGILIRELVTLAIGRMLGEEGAKVYAQLGETARAEDARSTHTRLQEAFDQWKDTDHVEVAALLKMHGSRMAALFTPIGVAIGQDELTPGRMHEHVLVEYGIASLVITLLALALAGTLVQGAFWLYRLRGAASAPLLLAPPAREIARALCLGILLPVAGYWLYTRLPGVGGREFGWGNPMALRFAAELLAVAALMLWLPAHCLRRYIRRRCEELGLSLPPAREERGMALRVRGGVLIALLLAGLATFLPGEVSLVVRVAGGLSAVVVLVFTLRYESARRREHGLYYGTVARSLAPVYALAILLLVAVVQPWLLRQEAHWLRQDTLIFGGLRDRDRPTAEFGLLETRAAKRLRAMTLEALEP